MDDAQDQWLEARFTRLRQDGGSNDWLEVSRSARRGFRRAVAATTVMLSAIALSAPALGWHRTVLNWLEADDAAPAVKLEFARLGVSAPPEHKLGIEHEQARTVTTVEHDGKRYVLSVAPTATGGFCFWWSDLTASCRQERTPPSGFRERRDGDLATFRLGTIWSPDSKGVIQSVAGNLIGLHADQLHAVYADGARVEIPVTWVSEPIDAGFYLYFVPESHREPGKHMVALVASSSEGRVVARQTFQLTPPGEIERLAKLPNGDPVRVPAKAIVSHAEKLIDFTPSKGRQVTLWEMPTTEGGVCYHFNRGGGCPPPGLPEIAFSVGILGGSQPVLLFGKTRPDVATVLVRFEDETEQRVRPVRGYVLTEIAPDHYPQGRRPVEAVALARSGKEVARHPLSRSAGIYPCENPVDQGFGVKSCP